MRLISPFSKFRPFFLALLTALFSLPSFTQNLVPNPGFEEHDDCTGGVDWSNLQNWQIPTCTYEPFYWNACNNVFGGGSGIPQNFVGFQYAHGGDGYLLLATYIHNYSYAQNKITTHLTEPLEAGHTYCVQMWFSLADSSEARSNLLHGMFTTDLPSGCNQQDTLFASQAQMTFATDQVDTASWHLVEGQYTAAGGEEYFTFGNFLPDSLTDVHVFGPFMPTRRSMFYTDDIYVGSCDVGIVDDSAPLHITALFPNPALTGQSIQLVLSKPLTSSTQLAILDMQGRQVSALTMPRSSRTISLSSGAMPPGIYSVRLNTSPVIISKLVLQ